jgi:hypothetical protein
MEKGKLRELLKCFPQYLIRAVKNIQYRPMYKQK